MESIEEFNEELSALVAPPLPLVPLAPPDNT